MHHSHLVGFETIEEDRRTAPQQVVSFDELIHIDYFEKKERKYPTDLGIAKSPGQFVELRPGYSKEQAIEEATRCFHCGQCFLCGSCVDDCPGNVLSMGRFGPEINYPDECWHCGNCRISRPCGAVRYEFPLSMLV